MFRVIAVGSAIVIYSFISNTLSADEALKINRTRWIGMLREQLPLVSDSERQVATAMTVVLLTEAELHADALKIVKQQSSADVKDSLLVSVVSAMAQKSAFEAAYSTIKEISKDSSKERAKYELAKVLASIGEIEHAERLIHELSDVYLKERVMGEICEYLARAGKLDEALARSVAITDPHRKNEVAKLTERIKKGTVVPLEQLSGSLRDRIHTLTAFSSEGKYDSAILAIVAAKTGDRGETLKHLRESLAHLDSPDIPPKKIMWAILASIALVELGDDEAAGDIVVKLQNRVGKDWSGVSTAFGTPILMSLLVRLERFDAVDEILERNRARFESDPTSSRYLSILESLAESLVEHGKIVEFESRLASVKTPDERLYLLTGAIIGSDYALQQ